MTDQSPWAAPSGPPVVGGSPAPGDPPAEGYPAPGGVPAPGYPAPGGPPAQGYPAPGPGPDASPGGWGRRRIRPWWGLGDVLLGVPLILIVAFAGSIAGLVFVARDEIGSTLDGTAVSTPVSVLALSLLAQQAAQGLWPLLVTKWKGLGAAADWRLRFKPVDLLIGPGAAIMAFGLAAVAGGIVANLVNLTDESQADNTQFLRDAQGSVWLYVLLFAAVVGAPLSEEIFFRGLILRAFEKRAGKVVAVIGSTIAFTLPHFIGSGLAGTAVLFASIGAVGLVFAVVAVTVDRIGPTIVAHVLFNAVGAASALGWFDSLTP